LGVHAPTRGHDHKKRTHTLPPSETEGSPGNHSSPRDPPYQKGKHVRNFLTELTPLQKDILRLAGVPEEAYTRYA
ncbi:MAG: hypothetical protein ACYCPN_07625, partial [Thermoplasmata archaeon]